MSGKVLNFPAKRTRSGNYNYRRAEPGLYLHLPSGTYHVRKKFDGLGIPPLNRSLETKSVREARVRMLEEIEAWKDRHLGRSNSGPRGKHEKKFVSEIIDEILEHYTPTQRPGTQTMHRVYLRKIREEWGGHEIDAITVIGFKAWIAKERKRPRKITEGGVTKIRPPRKTFTDYAKHMNLLFTFARQHEYTTRQLKFTCPDKELRNQLIDKQGVEMKTGRRILTEEEREILKLKGARVLSTAEIRRLFAMGNPTLRDELICAYTLAMRKREALEAPWDEIDLGAGTWTLPPERVKTGSKTGHGRVVPISGAALEMLKRRFTENAGRSRFVFPGWSTSAPGADKPVNDNKTAWATAKRKAGIKGRLRWHDIRHTALTHLILGDETLPADQRERMKRPVVEVSEVAGGSVRTIQAVYLHATGAHLTGIADALKLE